MNWTARRPPLDLPPFTLSGELMDSGLELHPIPSSFPFALLPTDIQERILALLPIRTLIVCKAVSHSWRSTIHSPTFTPSHPRHRSDLIFLLFSDTRHRTLASAYLPSQDRWIRFPFPAVLTRVIIAGSSLILADLDRGQLSILNPFSHRRPLRTLPPMGRYYALAFIEDSPSDYKIIAVTVTDRLYSKILHSQSGRWEPHGQLDRKFAVLGNAVVLHNLLFCLSRGPDHLLTFDPVGGEWSVLDLAMPVEALVCSHLMIFEEELYLAAGVEEEGVIARIGIWELDPTGNEWREIGFMRDDDFHGFGTGGLDYFKIVDQSGIICFYTSKTKKILMFDLAVGRWWWPRPCDVPAYWRMWLGHAIEPHISLLK